MTKYLNIDGHWIDPATLTRYPVKIQWDREGENVETIEFHSKKERNAFLSGVMQAKGWDAPDWSFLPPIDPAPDSCGKGCCIVDEYHSLKDKENNNG